MKSEVVKILMSQIDPDPYPHIVVDDFFDLETYMQIMQHFPDPDIMSDGYLDFTKQADLVRDQAMVEADDGRYEMQHVKLPNEGKDFWLEFTSKMFPNGNNGTILGGPPEAICRRCDVDFRNVYACARLVVDQQGSGIGPHSDRRDKRISAIVYLGEAEGACGTMLLAPKYGIKPDDPEKHYTFEDFNLVKTVEHKPNRLIAWPVDRPSYHAYHQAVPCHRKTLKFFIQEKIDPNTVRDRIAQTRGNSADWRKVQC